MHSAAIKPPTHLHTHTYTHISDEPTQANYYYQLHPKDLAIFELFHIYMLIQATHIDAWNQIDKHTWFQHKQHRAPDRAARR